MKADLNLAARRAALIEECALQRDCLAQELALLRSPFSLEGLRERLASRNPLLLAAGGVLLGFVLTRPRRVLALAARGLSLLGTVRKLLPR
jgi:hypothetical protein